MKKLLAAISTIVFCLTVFAGDTEDIKALIDRHYQLLKTIDFEKIMNLYTDDAIEISRDGTEKKVKDLHSTVMRLSKNMKYLDGKHLREFTEANAMEHTGRTLNKEQRERVEERLKDPKYQERYQMLCAFSNGQVSSFRKNITEEHASIKNMNIQVTGNTATAVFDNVTTDVKNGLKVPETTTLTLRKVNGQWKICKAVLVEKKTDVLPKQK